MQRVLYRLCARCTEITVEEVAAIKVENELNRSSGLFGAGGDL